MNYRRFYLLLSELVAADVVVTLDRQLFPQVSCYPKYDPAKHSHFSGANLVEALEKAHRQYVRNS
jgi:hypothetical protein